eukprot:scaffold363_cov56-Cylindrotheca_fusiformis.AAC.3
MVLQIYPIKSRLHRRVASHSQLGFLQNGRTHILTDGNVSIFVVFCDSLSLTIGPRESVYLPHTYFEAVAVLYKILDTQDILQNFNYMNCDNIMGQ